MLKIFPDAVQYDEPKGVGTREEVDDCDLAIICVPTPSNKDGSCDISIVKEVVAWTKAPLILIKSTIKPGTTDALKRVYNKRICFSAEYMGEGNYFTPFWKYPDPTNPISHGFMVIGGDSEDCSDILDFFIPKLGPSTHVRIITALEAEIVKYAENTWGATKVIFAHLLRDICEKVGANWYQVREGWLEDPRVEEMHTAAFKKRGFGGKCFPKDLIAFLKFCDENGLNHLLLRAVKEQNSRYHDDFHESV